MTPETTIEKHLRREARRLGGRSDKLLSATKGVPDRLVLLPGGAVHLVETKAPGGVLSPAQLLWHEHAADLGTEVVVLASIEDVDAWIAEQTASTRRHMRPGRGGAWEVRR